MNSNESIKKPKSHPLARVQISTVPKPHTSQGQCTYQSGPCQVELPLLVPHCSQHRAELSRQVDTEAKDASQPFHCSKATRRCTYQSGPYEVELPLLVQHCGSHCRAEIVDYQNFEVEANDAAKSA
jgi:hypothetical protein